jgi:DNA-binding Xre family transcriptional regulator
MANTFNRLVASGTLAGSTLKTMPAGTTWVIIGLMAANVSGSLLTIDLKAADKYLVKDVPIPQGSTLNLLEGKLVLVEGDTLEEVCSVDAGVEYIISYMEMT